MNCLWLLCQPQVESTSEHGLKVQKLLCETAISAEWLSSEYTHSLTHSHGGKQKGTG